MEISRSQMENSILDVEKPKINPISFSGSEANGTQPLKEVDEAEIRDRAKDYEPACKSLLLIIDGALYKSIVTKATTLLDDDEKKAEAICESCRITKESLKAGTEASARILARHTESTETADYIILGGVAVQMAKGYMDVMNLLKKEIAKKQLIPLPRAKPIKTNE